MLIMTKMAYIRHTMTGIDKYTQYYVYTCIHMSK